MKKIHTLHTGNTFSLTHSEPKRGGMGEVYFAKREADGKDYALKSILPEKFDRPDIREKFRMEAFIWICLGRHPNIVQACWYDEVYDEARDLLRPFLIMEYIPPSAGGHSLAERLHKRLLRRPPFFDTAEIARIAVQVLNGLLHARTVFESNDYAAFFGSAFLHRDIKPSNLLVTPEGKIKVTDFGLAQLVETTDSPGGSPPYMSPEQWEGTPLLEKSDIYALGCTMYELAVGTPPFIVPRQVQDRMEAQEILKIKHSQETPLPLRHIDPALAALISQCLEKSPDARPAFVDLRERLIAVINKDSPGEDLLKNDVPTPLDSETWNFHGMGFSQLKAFKLAEKCFDNAIAENEEDARFFLNRGAARLALEKVEAALTDFRKAAKLDKELVEAPLNEGNLLAQNEKYEAALAAYGRAEEIYLWEPAQSRAANSALHGSILLGRANVLSLQMPDVSDEAIAAFSNAINLYPDLVQAYFGRGLLYARRGEYQEACRDFKKAIDIKPDYDRALTALERLKAQINANTPGEAKLC